MFDTNPELARQFLEAMSFEYGANIGPLNFSYGTAMGQKIPGGGYLPGVSNDRDYVENWRFEEGDQCWVISLGPYWSADREFEEAITVLADEVFTKEQHKIEWGWVKHWYPELGDCLPFGEQHD